MSPTRIESLWFLNHRSDGHEARGAFTATASGSALRLKRVFGDDCQNFAGLPVEVLSTQGSFPSVAVLEGPNRLSVQAPEWFDRSNRRRAARHPSSTQVTITEPINQAAMIHDVSLAGCALYFEDLGALQVGDQGRMTLNTTSVEFTVKNRRSNGHHLVAIAGVAFNSLDSAAHAWIGLEVARARMRAGQELLDRHHRPLTQQSGFAL